MRDNTLSDPKKIIIKAIKVIKLLMIFSKSYQNKNGLYFHNLSQLEKSLFNHKFDYKLSGKRQESLCMVDVIRATWAEYCDLSLFIGNLFSTNTNLP